MPRKKLRDTETVQRLLSKSPDYFKKIQGLGLTLSSIGGILALFPLTSAIGIPLLAAGGAMTIIGKLPKKDVSVDEIKKLKEELEALKFKQH